MKLRRVWNKIKHRVSRDSDPVKFFLVRFEGRQPWDQRWRRVSKIMRISSSGSWQGHEKEKAREIATENYTEEGEVRHVRVVQISRAMAERNSLRRNRKRA